MSNFPASCWILYNLVLLFLTRWDFNELTNFEYRINFKCYSYVVCIGPNPQYVGTFQIPAQKLYLPRPLESPTTEHQRESIYQIVQDCIEDFLFQTVLCSICVILPAYWFLTLYLYVCFTLFSLTTCITFLNKFLWVIFVYIM